ncbi:MAG: hypothetical protein WBH60_03880 [Fervidobacterium sp.]
MSKITPGELIRIQLELDNKSIYDFASEMDMHLEEVQHLITGIRRIEPQIALKLEYVLKIPAHYWLYLEQHSRKAE